MIMRYIFFFFFLFSCSFIQAQNFVTSKTASKKAVKFHEYAVQASFNKQYKEALSYLNRALELEPTFIDAHIQLGNVHYDLGQLEKAETSFLKVLSLDEKYAENAIYNIGLINWKLERYDKSTKYFQRYLDSDARSSKRRERAKNYLKNSTFLATATKNPIPVTPINLGTGINTKADEYLPSITADESTLIYNRVVGGRLGHEDFYVSKFVDGKWQQGKPILGVNTPDSEGAQCVSPDGKLLIFTACNRRDGVGRCDLYFTENICGKWTPAKNMGEPISSTAFESQPSISHDNKTLYFTSDRKGGYGGKDIWYSVRKQDGSWSQPINAGKKINSNKDEKAPFLHPDGQTMYFLSMGHPGMGLEDIFISRRMLDGSWDKPVNMGYPINSKDVEGPVVVSFDGQTAYSSSYKELEGAQGKMDIYSFEIPAQFRPKAVTYVKGKVKDDDTRKTISANAEVIDLDSGKTLFTTKSDCNGEFLITLPTGKNYMLNINEKGYLFHSENFELTEKTTLAKPFLLKIDLVPIPKNLAISETEKPQSKPIILKNVFFETASAALRPISLIELNRLKNLLDKNPNLTIQINGHTDNVGTEEDNLTLSTNRAKAVYSYLIENGIVESRLKFKGFGETEPIATNTTVEGRQENRRTEFVVL